MSEFAQKMGDIVLSNGLAGVCVIVLAYCSRELFKKYCEVQEKRISENAANRTALAENTIALTRLADAMQRSTH